MYLILYFELYVVTKVVMFKIPVLNINKNHSIKITFLVNLKLKKYSNLM